MQRDEVAETGAVIPLVSETLSITKRVVETGTTRIAISTETIDTAIRETLHGEEVQIERVAIGREVTTAPAIRHEEGGAVLVVPVVEEILVVERRLVLKEEVRIRRIPTTELHESTIPLRRQTARVEQTDAPPAPSSPGEIP